MRLVVMAALLVLVLVLAGAAQGCSFGCRLTNFSFPVESCGRVESITTTRCEGHCYNEDPVYSGYADLPDQKVCNGDWTTEVTHIKGCPVAVSYPLARSCRCAACSSHNSHCGRFYGKIPNCLPS